MENATCSKGWEERCKNSRGPKCECSCGGANHGRNHGTTLTNEDMMEAKRVLERPPREFADYEIIEGYGVSREVFVGGKRLDPAYSQSVFNHSPDGFEWGYSGSGPSQLALAIMLEITDRATALRHYQDFKCEFIAPLAQGLKFGISVAKVKAWLAERPAAV